MGRHLRVQRNPLVAMDHDILLVSDYVNGILEARLSIMEMDEHFGTEAFAKDFPKTEEHIGWPMLLTFVLQGSSTSQRPRA